jgi:hypothetical protein
MMLSVVPVEVGYVGIGTGGAPVGMAKPLAVVAVTPAATYTVAPLLLLMMTVASPGGTVHRGTADVLLRAGELVLLRVPLLMAISCCPPRR